MSDVQLERSVLEAKERDELFAIAVALGTSPAARTKKADLVSHILQVTGVEADAAPAVDKPRRPRARKPAAVPAESPVTDGSATQLELATETSTNGHAPQAVTEQFDQVAPVPAANGNGNGSASANGNGNQAGHAPATAERASAPAGDNQPGDSASGFQRSDQGRQPRHDLDPGLGNSRRRRRRNREKTPRAPEREFTAQQPAEAPYTGELVQVSGLLDLREEGYGFLRTNGYLASSTDVYVSITQVRRYGLRKGDLVDGSFRPAANNEKYPALVKIDSVAGLPPDDARNRRKFESLTPLFPDDKLALEIPGEPGNVTARIVDLVSPIGKGQRGLIVSPPKAGKTTVLKQIAHSIEANNPDVHLMVLLVDERPEEVTDMRRSVKGEVIASTFDRPADEHTQVAELAIERAKRLVEAGRDVVIVLDGITRLARAYNLAQPATGRIMSGGIDTGALYPPKKFFGSARNIEEGGSLTILATALVETGSRMDEVIFEEFKGTGNMELRLDRKLAERRIYPALDVNASSTRHEELLFDRNQLQQVWKLRRVLNALASDGNGAAGLELLVDKIRSTRSNEQFLAEIAKTPAPAI
jgi:transcription termination factor Rho